MQNLRVIKGRIKSAKNIAQITKAMELVAASKMKKAQAAAESGKIYAEKIREMVMTLGGRVDTTQHPLLAKQKNLTGKRMAILISTNKGLCGGLNSSLFRFTMSKTDLKKNEFVTIGNKGSYFVSGFGGSVTADFSQVIPFSQAVPAVSQLAMEAFLNSQIDGVDLIYNQFVSVLRQEPRIKSILPLTLEPGTGQPEKKDATGFVIEPDPDAVFSALLPSYVENQIRDAILQAEASEQAARMVAMRNATENATSFIDDLTLIFNKVRQEKITNEIADLVTARAAIVTE